MLKFGVGQSATRLEDQRLLTGHGAYTGDINLDGQAYGVVVRSPYAHAQISEIDTSAAKADVDHKVGEGLLVAISGH